MASTQDGSNDGVDIWQNAKSAQRQALLAPSQTSEARESFLSRLSPADVLLRGQYTALTASISCPRAEQLTEMDKGRQCLDDAIASVLVDTPWAKKQVVVLAGPTGAGKSVYVEKLAQDWAKSQVLQSYDLLLHVCVSECVASWASQAREPGSVDNAQECLSLEKLLLLAHPHLSPETLSHILKDQQSLSSTQHRLLLILDGLDETPLSSSVDELLVPPSEEELLTLCSDPWLPVPIHHLLHCLAHGALLPGASLVITSRCVPDLDFVPTGSKIVEVLGFSPSQRSQFFQSFLRGDSNKHDQASELTQLCERAFGPYEFGGMPLFCWTLASAARALQQQDVKGASLPETLTQLLAQVTALMLRPSASSTTSPEADAVQKMPPGCTLLRGLARLARDRFLMDDSLDSQESLRLYGLEPFLSSPQLRVFLREGFDQTFVFWCPMMKQFLVAISFFMEGCGWDKDVEETMLDLNKDLDELSPAERLWTGLADTFVAGLSEASQRAPLEGLLEASYAEAKAAEFQGWLETSARETLEGYSEERHLHCFHLLRETQNPALVQRSISSPSSRLGMSYDVLGRTDCMALSYVLSCAVEVQWLNLYNSKNLTSDHTKLLLPVFKRAERIT